MCRGVAVVRDACFSPNSESADRAILQAVAGRLGVTTMVAESRLAALSAEVVSQTDFFLSMGRQTATLDFLRRRASEGALVLNSPDGVARCVRSVLHRLMKTLDVPMPPQTGTYGHWVKRGDAAAQTRDDVVFVPRDRSVQACVDAFARRGVTDVVVMAHVPGDVVKFYGVEGTGFFRCFYPTDDGRTKFGLERVNGPAHHYPFDGGALQRAAEKLSRATDVPIYGGDAIIDEEGRFFLVDFNDWPSFARCRDEAADAIARLVEKRLQGQEK